MWQEVKHSPFIFLKVYHKIEHMTEILYIAYLFFKYVIPLLSSLSLRQNNANFDVFMFCQQIYFIMKYWRKKDHMLINHSMTANEPNFNNNPSHNYW